MKTTQSQLRDNLSDVQRRIAEACERSGRSPDAVTLVAVTKYAEPEWVRELVRAGVHELAESRPQQLVERSGWFAESDGVRWHLVGHLQRNKARRVLPVTSLIHSVDSLRLLQTLDRLADEEQLSPHVLLEVNVSGEEAKHGFAPEELRDSWGDILECRRVNIDGLMTMAPYSDDPEDSREVFRRLCDLRNQLRQQSPEDLSLEQLSMGMSGDFEVAVEEGATLVRVGSLLFDGLNS